MAQNDNSQKSEGARELEMSVMQHGPILMMFRTDLLSFTDSSDILMVGTWAKMGEAAFSKWFWEYKINSSSDQRGIWGRTDVFWKSFWT